MRPGARPRWQYLLWSAGLACVAAPSFAYASEFGDQNSLAVNVCAVVGIWTGIAALIALARAVRKRRSCDGHLPQEPKTQGSA